MNCVDKYIDKYAYTSSAHTLHVVVCLDSFHIILFTAHQMKHRRTLKTDWTIVGEEEEAEVEEVEEEAVGKRKKEKKKDEFKQHARILFACVLSVTA